MTRIGILASRVRSRGGWTARSAAALVILLALPVFLLAGWSLTGWAIAAVLWLGVQAFGLLLGRLKPSPDNVAASGVWPSG